MRNKERVENSVSAPTEFPMCWMEPSLAEPGTSSLHCALALSRLVLQYVWATYFVPADASYNYFRVSYRNIIRYAP